MHEHAGRQARPVDLIDLEALTRAYYEVHPEMTEVAHRVAFGTSGHRGSSLDAAFNEDHILAVAQAIVEYRAAEGINGPAFVGRDTHGLFRTRLAHGAGGAGRQRRGGADRLA